MKIGVFDSGIGGQAVADSLQNSFPNATITVVNDSKNVPYGSKSANQILTLTQTAINPLLQENCDVIVLACNTVTAVTIETLRLQYPRQVFIGLEPMLKPAGRMSRNKNIIVCATPATLKSARYQKLKADYTQETHVIEPDCHDRAVRIEASSIDKEDIRAKLAPGLLAGADVVVLACTHYHWIKEYINEIAGSTVEVIDPSNAVTERIRSLVSQ